MSNLNQLLNKHQKVLLGLQKIILMWADVSKWVMIA